MVLEFDLCKQLKEAGFRQNGESPCHYIQDGTVVHTHITRSSIMNEKFYIPTLRELIVSYKGKSFCLTRNKFNEYQANGISGSSPEEAVAKLWLHDYVDNSKAYYASK